MPFFLLEYHPGMWPTPDRGDFNFGPAPSVSGWRLFAGCTRDRGDSCSLLFDDPAEFSARTFRDFQNLMNYLYEAGRSGRPWRDIFQDGRIYHSVDAITVQRREGTSVVERQIEVMQFKKARADVRILNVQTGMGRCNLLMTHVYEKDSQKTPEREKRRAADIARAFYAAIDEKQVRLISTQARDHNAPNF